MIESIKFITSRLILRKPLPVDVSENVDAVAAVPVVFFVVVVAAVFVVVVVVEIYSKYYL